MTIHPSVWEHPLLPMAHVTASDPDSLAGSRRAHSCSAARPCWGLGPWRWSEDCLVRRECCIKRRPQSHPLKATLKMGAAGLQARCRRRCWGLAAFLLAGAAAAATHQAHNSLASLHLRLNRSSSRGTFAWNSVQPRKLPSRRGSQLAADGGGAGQAGAGQGVGCDLRRNGSRHREAEAGSRQPTTNPITGPGLPCTFPSQQRPATQLPAHPPDMIP